MSEEKKNEILKNDLDTDELEAVSGCGAEGRGGCRALYYKKRCSATVESGSWCKSDDFCYRSESQYKETVGGMTIQTPDGKILEEIPPKEENFGASSDW